MSQEPENEGGGRGRRALLSLLFAFIYQVAETVFWAVALFQNIYLLVVGERNDRLNRFSATLSAYIYECLSYVCLRSSDLPWPFDDPKPPPAEDQTGAE